MTVYKHKCPEWDYMEIDIDVEEIHCCDCFNDEVFKAIKKWVYMYQELWFDSL